jgi:hypothetical protein
VGNRGGVEEKASATRRRSVQVRTLNGLTGHHPGR